MRDDLQLIRDKTTELEIKVDRDINELRSSMERGKNDTVGLFVFCAFCDTVCVLCCQSVSVDPRAYTILPDTFRASVVLSISVGSHAHTHLRFCF